MALVRLLRSRQSRSFEPALETMTQRWDWGALTKRLHRLLLGQGSDTEKADNAGVTPL